MTNDSSPYAADEAAGVTADGTALIPLPFVAEYLRDHRCDG